MASARKSSRSRIKPEVIGRQHVLGLLVSEWAIKILQALNRSPKLYAEMRREFHSASKATLAQTLRDLQGAGLVWRKVYPTSPVRVEYSLTALGRSFIEPLKTLCEWAEVHERELSAVSGRQGGRTNRREKARKNSSRPKSSRK
jgi:DNA-binding HxlR family transcriptional regulator